MVKSLRPAFLTLALLVGAAPAFAQGVASTTPAPAGTSTQRPVAAAPATPVNPAGQAGMQRPAVQGSVQAPTAQGTVQAPVRPAQPSGTAATTTPAPGVPRIN